MRFLILLLFISGTSFAATPMETLLNLPIEKRVKEFTDLAGGDKFLRNVAFDKRYGLQARWRALTTMGRWDAALFRHELDRALTSGEWFMRNAALIALQSDERARAVNWSMRLLDDPALVVRTQAVRNLIALDAREAEPKLWEKMFAGTNFHGQESLWVRIHIAEALATFASPQRTRSFQRMLMDPDERLHKWAILGLETATGFKIGDKSEPLEVRRDQWLARLGAQEI